MSQVNLVLPPGAFVFRPVDYDESRANNVRVKGSTDPNKTGQWVVHLLRTGKYPVDLSYVGGNAAQQATKVASFVSTVINKDYGLVVVWLPFQVLASFEAAHPEAVRQGEGDWTASVWRSVIIGDMTMLERKPPKRAHPGSGELC